MYLLLRRLTHVLIVLFLILSFPKLIEAHEFSHVDAELEAALEIAGDPSQVKVMTNSGHIIKQHAFSSKGTYMFTANDTEFAVWERASMRIISRFPIRGITKIIPHPTEEDLIVIGLNRFDYANTPSLPTYLVNWQKGKLLAHLPSDYNVNPKLIQIPYEIFITLGDGPVPLKYAKSHESLLKYNMWQNIVPLGSVTTNHNDSLLLASGPCGLVYDLSRARTSAVIPLNSHLLVSDTVLDIPKSTYCMLPKPKKWKYSNERAYINRSHYDAVFDYDGTILTGSPNGKLFRYDTKGKLLDSIVMPNLTGPVFSVSRSGRRLAAATLSGIYVGTDSMYLPQSFNPCFHENRVLLFEDAMANLVSRSFGKGYFIGSFPRSIWQFIGDFEGNVVAVGNDTKWGELTDIKISPDERCALGTNGYSAAFFDLTHTDSLRLINVVSIPRRIEEFVVASEFLPDGKIAIASEHGYLFFAKKNSGTGEYEFARSAREHLGRIRSVAITNDSTKILTADNYGQITIWDARAPHKVIVKIFNKYPNGIFTVTPDQYYSYEKIWTPLAQNIHFVKDNRPYSFDQFDIVRNRPDIVVERLGGSEYEVELLRRAWRKRLSKIGIDERALASDYHTPCIEITNRHQLPVLSGSRHVKIKVSVTGTRYDIERVMLSLNGVPLLGDAGQRIAKNENTDSLEYDVELTSGSNLISVSAMNSAGAKSLAAEATVQYIPVDKQKPRLWVLAVGVGDYIDQNYKLNYAAKDSRDFIDIFSDENTNVFSEINTMSFTDLEFNSEAINKGRQFLSQAGRDDVAVAFYAGHGVLDSKLDYYLAPADCDFRNPAENGISMEAFISMFGSSKALRRYVFVDACHSGAVDKQEFLADNTITLQQVGDIRFRSSGKLKFKSAAGFAASQLADNIFSDFTTTAGVTLISASAGGEQALEGVDWQNGVFTHTIKEAVRELFKYGHVSIEWIADYVRSRVPEITAGAQHPHIRTTYPSETIIYKKE